MCYGDEPNWLLTPVVCIEEEYLFVPLGIPIGLPRLINILFLSSSPPVHSRSTKETGVPFPWCLDRQPIGFATARTSALLTTRMTSEVSLSLEEILTRAPDWCWLRAIRYVIDKQAIFAAVDGSLSNLGTFLHCKSIHQRANVQVEISSN